MLPEGWTATKLGKLVSTVTSGSRDWAQYYSENGSKFIRMTNLNREGIHLKLDDLKFVNIQSDSSDGKRTSLQYGDILISITAELGKIGWIPENFGEAYINQHTALIRIKSELAQSQYIAYLLSSSYLNNVINGLNDSGAKAGLNLPTIRSIPVITPSLPEQKKIAKILSTWDKAISTTEQLLTNSQQQKKALMQQLLTGKKRFQGFDGEWKKKTLFSIAQITMGSSPKSEAYNELNNGLPLLQGNADIKNRVSVPRIFTSEITKECLPNDILLSVRAPVGAVAMSHHHACIGRGIAAIRAKDGISQKYLYQWLLAFEEKWDSLSQGSTFESVNSNDIKGLSLLLPDFKEQQKIAAVLSAADHEIQALQQKLNYLKQEKKALMQALLTGKRRVSTEQENVE